MLHFRCVCDDVSLTLKPIVEPEMPSSSTHIKLIYNCFFLLDEVNILKNDVVMKIERLRLKITLCCTVYTTHVHITWLTCRLLTWWCYTTSFFVYGITAQWTTWMASIIGYYYTHTTLISKLQNKFIWECKMIGKWLVTYVRERVEIQEMKIKTKNRKFLKRKWA